MTDAKTDTAPAGSTAANALPLFYKKPEALNPLRHGSLGLTARGQISPLPAPRTPSPWSPRRCRRRCAPIVVFIGAAKAPVIITGLRQDQNLFVDADWQMGGAAYIPAYVRRYPFILADESQTTGRLTLCIDRASDRVVDQTPSPKDSDKIAPFFSGNEPAEASKQALAFCSQFQTDFNATRAMIDKIDAHGLFAPRQSKVTLEAARSSTSPTSR